MNKTDLDFTEKTEREKPIFEGRILKLYNDDVRLSNGKLTTREYISHNGGVGVLAVEDGTVCLVKQFRYPYREEVLEIPAGKLEKGEDPLDCAKRELSEETGLSAKRYRSVGVFYPSPGYTNEKLYIFFAEELSAGLSHPDEDEQLKLVRVPLAKARQMMENGEIKDAKTMIALQYYFLNEKG